MNIDEPGEQTAWERVRRVRFDKRELLDRIIQADVVPVPVHVFTNSLFVELTFETCQDAEVLDHFAQLVASLPFYWERA